MANASRDAWLEEGVPALDLDDLAMFAPIEQWDIIWESTLSEYEKRTIPPEEQEAMKRRVFLTSVKCPKCGTSIKCHLNAVTDFYHDDGEPATTIKPMKQGSYRALAIGDSTGRKNASNRSIWDVRLRLRTL